jgi:26S proteasome regulatory subunit N3
VIEAKIDHENGWLSSHEVLDLYSTDEPQRAFHKRIAFCLDVHNEAVKSMRYPPDDTYKKEAKEGEKVEDEEKTIEELIKELEDDFDE